MSYYAVFTVQECIRFYEELGQATVCDGDERDFRWETDDE